MQFFPSVDSDDISLDLIIGSSQITRNNFSSNFNTQSCAFPSGGFLTIISLKGGERNNIVLSDTTTVISALSFSRTGNSIAVGEAGSSSRVFILTFEPDKYDKILSKIIINTEEQGFSCLALDYDKHQLITVGYGEKPILSLWDIRSPTKLVSQCSLQSVPTNIALGDDIVLVSGDKMLKIVHLVNNNPINARKNRLSTSNINIGEYKNAKFVAVATIAKTCYALTATGTLCYFSSENQSNRINLKTYKTNRGNTTSISLDKDLIVCGTTKGSVLSLKRTTPPNFFGQFLSPEKSVVAVGVLKHSIVSVYSNGHILFWKRKLNTQPQLSIRSPVGPICSLQMLIWDSILFSTGNDGYLRAWSVSRPLQDEANPDLISRSTSRLMNEVQIGSYKKDFKKYGGVRCLCYANNGKHLFAGDDKGVLFGINIMTLETMIEIKDNSDAIHSIAADPNSQWIVTGGGDGAIRVYNIVSEPIGLSMVKHLTQMPINSVTFGDNCIIASSSEKIMFCRLPNQSCDCYAEYQGKSVFMSLSYSTPARLVFSACQDMSLYAFDVFTGQLFRKFSLSNSDFPMKTVVHQSGLVVASAMSDGHISIIDALSGDSILFSQTYAGMITDMIFDTSGLIVSTFGGCIMRFNLPESLSKILNEEVSPVRISVSFDPNVVRHDSFANADVFKSLCSSKKRPPEWVFKEVSEMNQPEDHGEVEGDIQEENDNLLSDAVKPLYIIDPRNEIDDVDEMNAVKDIIRLSFSCKNGKKSLLENLKLLKQPTSDDENETPEKQDDVQNNKIELPPISKSNQMNELANSISNLMKTANSYLSMVVTHPSEISAQNELREVVNQLSPIDEEFAAQCQQFDKYLEEIMKNAKEMLNIAQLSKECAQSMVETVEKT